METKWREEGEGGVKVREWAGPRQGEGGALVMLPLFPGQAAAIPSPLLLQLLSQSLSSLLERWGRRRR
jgi:hypothetical protein